MLHVIDPSAVNPLLEREFPHLPGKAERISIANAVGRVLAEAAVSDQYIPDFDRSLVDGYAVAARDTFGCSDAIPAMLPVTHEIHMSELPGFALEPGTCVAIPTGGAVPQGADAVQMLEFAEDYGDGTIGIFKPVAPGNHMVYRGDDVSPGKCLLEAGHLLRPKDIGALAALGITHVPVIPAVRIGILSTGDELIPAENCPGPGQIRDVNSHLLQAALASPGTRLNTYGIIPDQYELLLEAVRKASRENDLVLLSGGSSAGERDLSLQVLNALGTTLFHGIAMKPGKPTILGRIGRVPVFGLPGHPAVAFFVTELFVRPLVARFSGRKTEPEQIHAKLTENISANHGRAQYTLVVLEKSEGLPAARPIHAKSGLITTLTEADGYLCIPRDCEGYAAGTEVVVTRFP